MSEPVKHAPGPWRAEGRYVMALKEKTVCECPSGYVAHGKVDAANARLIAAAPDLLAACRLFLTYHSTDYAGAEFVAAHRALTDAMRAAVAKAEGRA